MKKVSALITLAVMLCVTSTSYALSLKFENKSKWEIHELYFAPTDSQEWGPDQLQDDVIEKNATFTLTKIAKGTYDVKIVDEDSDACEISDVDFTASEHFVLTDKILLGCQQKTAEEAEED